MQIKIIGSHQCPDTLYALHILAEKGYEVDFVDILGSHAGLKEYLTLRETDALYKDICGTQRLGICTCQQKLDTKLKKSGIKNESMYKIHQLF